MQSLNQTAIMTEYPSPTVLVVDDVQINVDLLTEVLSDTCSIIGATNGQSALKRAFHEIPDLVILDVMMPGMNGYEVCRRLKHSRMTRQMHCRALTTWC